MMKPHLYQACKEELLTNGFFHCSNPELATRLYRDVKPVKPTLYLHKDGSFSSLKVMTLKDLDLLTGKRAARLQEVDAIDQILSHLQPSRPEANQTITLTEGTEWDWQGDPFLVRSFLECCDIGALTNDDGYAHGLVLHGKLVYDGKLLVSDRHDYRHALTELAKKHPQLTVLWFNR